MFSAHWDQHKLTPSVASGSSSHPVVEVVAGLVKVMRNGNRTTYEVVLSENAALAEGSRVIPNGSRLTVSVFDQEPQLAAFPLDLLRLSGLAAKPNPKQPGQFYYNCRSVSVQRFAWECARDLAFLATQRSRERPFLVVSWPVNCPVDEKNPQSGVRMETVWPLEASSSLRGELQPILRFRCTWMEWTAQDVRDHADPDMFKAELTLWPNHCADLLGGALSTEVFAELMARGVNPVPFVALCEPLGPGDTRLKLMALMSDLAEYVAKHCPLVSADLASEHAATPATPAPTRHDGVINVSAHGMPPRGSTSYAFHAMTSSGSGDEESIRDALRDGTLGAVAFFAVPAGRKDKKRAKKVE